MKPSRPRHWMPLLGLLAAACAIQAPEIKVTGERGLLERQILGAYQGLSEELWMLTSLRAPGDSLVLAEERSRLLEALRRRRFNRDDRMQLLAGGWLGEGADGRIHPREGDGELPAAAARLRERLLEQENEDRDRLIERLLDLHPQTDILELTRVFAAIQAEESPAGAWIQAEDGAWERR
jgi:hypothetical protein